MMIMYSLSFSALAKCAESNTNPNFESIQPDAVDFSLPSEPTVDIPSIKEDYANYETFGDAYFKNLENVSLCNLFPSSLIPL